MTRARFSPLDVLLAAFAGLADVALAGGGLLVAPSFAAMYRDLGGELPWATELVLTPWPWLGSGLAVLVVGGVGLWSGTVGRRRLALAGGALLACAALAVLWSALYLPFFELAAATSAE